jgi:LCP family protein required for cell wall assembly
MHRTGGSNDRLRALGRAVESRAPGSRVANEEWLAALGDQVREAHLGAGPGAGPGSGGGGRRREAGGGRGGQHRAGGGGRRRYRRTKWTLGVIGLVVVVLVGVVAGYGWYLNHKIHRVTVKNLTNSASAGADARTENILLVGSTSRCALAVQNPAYGLCSKGVTGINSDVIMVLHLDPKTKTVSILSIPRDLFVPNARKEGANKVDAALYEGPTQLVDTVQEDFGIPIQHYVELNFDSFANVVDALGGISMYFPEPVYDAYSGLNIQTTGCIHLNGTQALQVVRARHLQYRPPTLSASTSVAHWPADPQSDLSRIRRDHEFLRVLASAVAKKGIGNPLTDERLVSGVRLGHGQPGARVPRRQREPGAPAHLAGGRGSARHLLLQRWHVRGRRVSGPARRPAGHRPVSGDRGGHRHGGGCQAARPRHGRRVGAERDRSRRAGDHHRRGPVQARLRRGR